MLVKIAWKNIWRNPTRSFVLIIAIGLGIWALTFLLGLTKGVIKSYISSAINNRTSHIQIHHPSFEEERENIYFFDANTVIPALEKSSFLKEYSPRVILDGMISSPRASRPVILYGVDEALENKVTGLESKITDGNPLIGEFAHPVLISHTLAGKLGVKVKSKVVINFQNIHGEVVASAFRIAGLIRNNTGKADEIIAYTPLDELRKLAGLGKNDTHEIAILTQDINQTDRDVLKLSEDFPSLSVLDYKELAPDLALMDAHIRFSTSIMTVIFMLALIFGIINTMLMAVLERYKEIGMLVAIGMKKGEVFTMVVLETIFLSLAGLPFGLALGGLTIYLSRLKGIDLGRWSDTLSEFGLLPIIYPESDFHTFVLIAGAVFLTAVIASIYPARKATSLNPIEAIHKI